MWNPLDVSQVFQKPKWKVKQTVDVQVELKGVDINFESHQYRDSMSWNWLRSYVSIEDLTIKPETFLWVKGVQRRPRRLSTKAGE